jgi:broad specificity phosphatase PhoE
MKTIWLVRHAESMSQIDDTYEGLNPDLSPKGERQARNLKPRIAQIKTDIVLLSPLTRAWSTYMLSEYKADKVMYDKRLIESDWEISGYYKSLTFNNLPDIAEKDITQNHLVPTFLRAKMLIDFIEKSDYSSYVLFGHWGVFLDLFNVFSGIPKSKKIQAMTENTGISRLEISDSGARSIVFWNDSSHLANLSLDN